MASSIFESVSGFLNDNNINYAVVEHQAFSSTQEAAYLGDVEMSQGAKSMVFKSLGKFLLAVTPADTRIDYKKLKKYLGTSNLRLASPNEVTEVTGCEIGSCHPFGNLIELRTICDTELAEKQTLAINAGERTRTLKIAASDYLKLVDPEIADISTR